MIRFILILSLVIISGLYLKIGYGYQGWAWGLGCGIFWGMALVVYTLELWWGRRYKEYLVAILLGALIGALVSVPCIQGLGSLSFLSPILEGVPWPAILKILWMGLGILLVSYWSQEEFSIKIIDVGVSSGLSRNFLRLRWAIRGALVLAFLALVFSHVQMSSRLGGFQDSRWLEMGKLGYDFDLKVERTVSFPSLSLWGVFALLILSEWSWGNFYLRRLWAFLPAAGFMMVMGDVGIEILAVKVGRYLPSDLFQLFLMALCGYLGFSWCVRAIRGGNYRLPFCRIEFKK